MEGSLWGESGTHGRPNKRQRGGHQCGGARVGMSWLAWKPVDQHGVRHSSHTQQVEQSHKHSTRARPQHPSPRRPAPGRAAPPARGGRPPPWPAPRATRPASRCRAPARSARAPPWEQSSCGAPPSSGSCEGVARARLTAGLPWYYARNNALYNAGCSAPPSTPHPHHSMGAGREQTQQLAAIRHLQRSLACLRTRGPAGCPSLQFRCPAGHPLHFLATASLH